MLGERAGELPKVTTSPQSYVFGIPVAVLGLAFFLFAVAAMSPWAWRSRRREVHIVRLASTVVGIGFVLYLIYAELFIIGSICLYCTSVHVLTFVLFALTAFAAAAWGLDPAKKRQLTGRSSSLGSWRAPGTRLTITSSSCCLRPAAARGGTH